MRLPKILFATGPAMLAALALQAEVMPRSVMVVDEGISYRFQCYRDTVTQKLRGPVLVSRTDNRPRAALEYLSKPSPTPAVILYPREEEFENFFGKESSYHAKPGEIVLYTYEDDKFTSLGYFDEGLPSKENEKKLVSMLRVLISKCQDRGEGPTNSDWAELLKAFKSDPDRWKPNRTSK